MSDLVFRSTVELAAAIRQKDIGSRELLDAYLTRIDELNGPINAVVTLDAAGARAAADAADTALARGEVLGPLHGVPVTVKDNMEVAGMRSTAGATVLADHVPTCDGLIAERLKAAGAVVFGKTNMPTFGLDMQTYNDVFGLTKNPWNLDRTTGGSSGGSAAALAAGLTGFEVGTDIGGSIRCPAHYCGVYGLKTTYGILPRRGHLGMPGARSYSDISVIGPLSRGAKDLQLGLDVLAGSDPKDRGVGWRLELPAPRHASLKDYRVAAWLDEPPYSPSQEVAARLRDTVEALRGAGITVDERARPNFDPQEAYRIYMQMLFGAISAGQSAEQYEMAKAAEGSLPDDDGYLVMMARYSVQRHREWLLGHEQREQLRAQWYEFFQNYDVLLCPVSLVSAFPHNIEGEMYDRTVAIDGQDRAYLDLLFWAGVTCAYHLPAVSAPVGRTADGLPVGIQIVGPYLEDRTPAAFTEHLETLVGGFTPPPGY